MQVSAAEPSKTKVRRYRSRRRKAFLRRHKIALPAAGMLLYGGLMAAVASSGDFPGALLNLFHPSSSTAVPETLADPSSDSTGRRSSAFAFDPAADGKPLPDGPQLSFAEPADGGTATETLKSHSSDDENEAATNSNPADSSGEPGEETLPSQAPRGGTFAVSSGGTVGLLVHPFGAARTAPSFTIASADPSTPTGGGTPTTGGPPTTGCTPTVPSAYVNPTDVPSTTPQDPPPEDTASKPDPDLPSDPGTNPSSPPAPGDNPDQNAGNPPQGNPDDPPRAGEPPIDQTEPVDAPVITVPEPASLALVGPALVGLWTLRRRRSRNRAG
jgi:hypothetical protein